MSDKCFSDEVLMKGANECLIKFIASDHDIKSAFDKTPNHLKNLVRVAYVSGWVSGFKSSTATRKLNKEPGLC